LRGVALHLRVDPYVVERAGQDRERGVGSALSVDLSVRAEVATLRGSDGTDHEPDHDQETDDELHAGPSPGKRSERTAVAQSVPQTGTGGNPSQAIRETLG
jgi:hypothetical protein